MGLDEQLNECIVDIFEKIDSIITDDYNDIWFYGEINTPHMNSAEFWYLDEKSKLISLLDMADVNKADQAMVDDTSSDLSDLLFTMAKVFNDNDMTVFNNIIIHYMVDEDGNVSMDMTIDYIDWLEAGFSTLDQLNYYLVQTVGEDYIRGYPEKRRSYLKAVKKMQKYAKKHSK